MLLTFNVNKQLIKRTDCEIPVAKSENYLYAQFSFTEEWQGTKTAIFNNGTPYSVQLDAENKCLVPWEVITASGFSVSVFCGQRITANVEFVKVLPTGYVEGQTPPPPSPSVYDQIIEELNGKLDPENIIAGENITITVNGKSVIINSKGGGGTDDYTDLENKPQINSVELNGNKSLSELGIQPSGNYASSSDLTEEETARQNADNNLQGQIDAITVSSDVIDVVGTYAELLAYDTTHVKANDIIKVLQDGTHNDALSYYRWVITQNVGAWVYVGSEGPFYTKSETETILGSYATTEVMNTALALKLDKADVATTTGNSDSKAISQKAATDAINNIKPARWLFVDTLPTSDIDTKAVYLTPNSRIFPSVESYIADDWGKGAVTYDELTGYKFIRLLTSSNILYNDSRNKSAEYEIYTTDGVAWTKVDESDEGGDNEWATKMGWTTATTTTGSTSGYQNIVWSNCTFCYNQNTYKHYNPDNNTAYITGLLVDVSQLNPFIKMMSTYNGSAWTDIGVCDFTKLFDGVKMKASKVTVTDGTTYTMADNTEYYGDNLLQPVFNSPTGDYECYFLLTFASSGTVGGAGDIFPDITRVIGDVPVFDNGETWEISIKNGIFVAGKVE